MEMWDEFSFLEDATIFDNWSLDSWCNNNGERGMLIAKEWDRNMNVNPIGFPI